MNGYKGFDEKMQCRELQYKENAIFEMEGDIELCKTGFHFCLNPLDVLRYYSPIKSVFATVTALGKTKTKEKEDTKVVTDKIQINAKIDLKSLIKLGVEFIMENSKCKTGNYSPSATSGNSSPSATSGDSSPSETKGKNSISCAIGRNSYAKSIIGNWIVLSEIDDNYNVICVKTVKVDGKKIKADTWYKLQKGKFIQVL
jgi:hypothetical protein